MNDDYDYTINNWEDDKIDLKNQLLRGIYSYGFETPSIIQKRVIYPILLNNERKERDIVAQAQSGTGKTGAFSISALQIIDEKINNMQCLIVAPTHELAHQINSVINAIGKFLKIRTALFVGGVSIEDNKRAMSKNPQVVVGTPGRINDTIRRRILNVDNIKLLIIDEADEMLSAGFKDQIYKIFQRMPNKVQIGLFSATIPEELKELTKQFMRDPVEVLVKTEQLTLQGIAQYFINLENDSQKFETVKDLFSSINISQCIIYCNSVKRVNDLEEAMRLEDFPVKKIHGKMNKEERETNYKEFRMGGCRVLITSDLFSRGIDIQQVGIVINFDIPKSEHTYLHRIGRSGRWGRKGIAINLQTKYDIKRLKRFEDYYHTQIMEMPMNYIEHLSQ